MGISSTKMMRPLGGQPAAGGLGGLVTPSLTSHPSFSQLKPFRGGSAGSFHYLIPAAALCFLGMSCGKSKANQNSEPVMGGHSHNLGTQEAEAGGSESSRPDWTTLFL